MELEEVPSYKLKDQWSRSGAGQNRRKKKRAGGGWFSRIIGGVRAASAPDAAASASGGSGSLQAVESLFGIGAKYGGTGLATGVWGGALAIPMLAAAVSAAAYGVGRMIAPPTPAGGLSGAPGTALFMKPTSYQGDLSQLPTTNQAIKSLGLASSPAVPPDASVPSQDAAASAAARRVAPAAASPDAGSSSSGGTVYGAAIPHLGRLPGGQSAVSNANAAGLSSQQHGSAGVAPNGQAAHALAALVGGVAPQQQGIGPVGGAMGRDALGQLGGANTYSGAATKSGTQEAAAGNASAAFDNPASHPSTVAGGVALGGAGDGNSNPGAQPTGTTWSSGGGAPGTPWSGGGGGGGLSSTPTLPPASNPGSGTSKTTRILEEVATALMFASAVLLAIASFVKVPAVKLGMQIAAAVMGASVAGIGGYLMATGNFWTGLMFTVTGGITAAMAVVSAMATQAARAAASAKIVTQMNQLYTYDAATQSNITAGMKLLFG
jgi:hypothetical protein